MARCSYPIYIPSKGRAYNPLTAGVLAKYGVSFKVVVEPQERDDYARAVGEENVLVLPFQNLGQGSIPARNWIWEHAKAQGAARHWCLDDNIRCFYRRVKAMRIRCTPSLALASVETFVDRFENVAVAGLNYSFFAMGQVALPPFFVNHHVYSCMLLRNDIPQRWRGRYNEDADLCLQVIAAGQRTMLVNAFLCEKVATMLMKGGNSDELYRGDGRLAMARELQRRWPRVVKVSRRWGRPQHVIDWPKLREPLVLRSDAPKLAKSHPMRLVQVREHVRSAKLRAMLEEA